MCDESFSATADTLPELVEIVALHLRQVKEQGYKSHEAYLKKHPEEQSQMSMLEETNPDDPSEILDSRGFRWDILRLVPFNRIFKELEIPLLTHRPPRASTESAIEKMVHPKTP